MICSKGHVLKSWDETIRFKDGRTPICRHCVTERTKERKALFPARVQTAQARYDRTYAERHAERRKAAHDRWIAKNRARWNAYMRALRAKKKASTLAGPRDAWTLDTPIGETSVPGLPGRNQREPRIPEKSAPSSLFRENASQDPGRGRGGEAQHE